ncbi:hypothetical protein K438DRAFT_1858887 [Mycena galopus ATCC 62051]|nr:hypothetical protein K438DRAFT_1858887 [Mycena galopus ATCC 62051]
MPVAYGPAHSRPSHLVRTHRISPLRGHPHQLRATSSRKQTPHSPRHHRARKGLAYARPSDPLRTPTSRACMHAAHSSTPAPHARKPAARMQTCRARPLPAHASPSPPSRKHARMPHPRSRMPTPRPPTRAARNLLAHARPLHPSGTPTPRARKPIVRPFPTHANPSPTSTSPYARLSPSSVSTRPGRTHARPHPHTPTPRPPTPTACNLFACAHPSHPSRTVTRYTAAFTSLSRSIYLAVSAAPCGSFLPPRCLSLHTLYLHAFVSFPSFCTIH